MESDLDRVFEKAMQRVDRELVPVERDYRLRVRRFLTAGNAGGMVASLSLAGTMIASASTENQFPPLDWGVFCAIVIFLLGLSGTALALISERGEHESTRHRALDRALDGFRNELLSEGVSPENLVDIDPRGTRKEWIFATLHAFGVWVAWICLSVGVVLGVMNLASFTNSPWW